MPKDFDKWNEKKKEIEDKAPNKFPMSGEIWWCYLGVNIGKEEDGTWPRFERPVLVIRSLNAFTCIIIPLTTSNNKNVHRLEIGNINGKKNQVIFSQIRHIDTKRLTNKMEDINKKIFESIRKSLKDML